MLTITKNPNGIRKTVLIFFLLFFGIIISLYYGRLGFMPKDHSIIFDGGYRILSGQIPFRDFNTPYALVPIMLQAVFFKMFGVSWFVYCLHAALFNGAFCVLVYFLLRSLGGSKIISFFYAFLSSFVYYPPIGVPFMDQHSFFFILLAIVMSVKASQVSGNLTRFLLWLTIPAIIVIAYLSKQNPGIFAVPVILFVLFTMTEKRRHLEMFFTLSAGFVAVFLFCLMVFKIFHMRFDDLILYSLQIPLDVFWHRIAANTHLDKWIYPFFYPILGNHNIYGKRELFRIVSFILVLSYLGVLFRNYPDKKSVISNFRGELPKLGLSLLLILMCRIFVTLSSNSMQNGIPYAFISFGILHIVFLKASRGMLRANKMLSFQSIINAMFILNAFVTLALFNAEVNETRMVNDMKFNKGLLQSSNDLPSELSFMAFVMPPHYKFNARDLAALTVFLKEQSENFFLWGDTSILYALTNKPSVNPILWFHPGLTYPLGNDFKLYENRLMDNIKKYNVRFIVIEDAVWSRITIDDFYALKSLVNAEGVLFRVFAGFKVYRLNY